MLSFKNLRISFGFDSEILDTKNVFNQCKQVNSDILSVVSDVSRPNFAMNTLSYLNFQKNGDV